jgi:hypothetical protein
LREAGLGVETDSVVARRMGVTPPTILNARLRLGVATPDHHRPPGLLESIQRKAARWIARGVRGTERLARKVRVTPYGLRQSAQALGCTIPADSRQWDENAAGARDGAARSGRVVGPSRRARSRGSLTPRRVRELLDAGLGHR